MKIKLNIVVILNIILLFVFVYITFKFQQYFWLRGDDLVYPFEHQKFSFAAYGRVPAAILTYIINIYLPNSLNIPLHDYIAGTGALIKSVLFVFVCLSASFGFWIYSSLKTKDIFANILNLPLLSVIFFLFALPLIRLSNERSYFGVISETIVFTEYFLCLFFYFLFFISFIYILFEKDKIKPIFKILIIINSFLLGFWNEIFNLSTLFSILLMLLILKLFYKEIFDVKKLLILLIPFLTGFLCFYIFSDYFHGNTAASHSIYWNTIFLNLDIAIFFKEYMKYLFIKNYIFYLIISVLIFYLFKKPKDKNYIFISVCFSIILGYLITNLFFIFIHDEIFLFQRKSFQCQFTNILEFIIIMLSGCIYTEYKRAKKYIICVYFASVILLAAMFYSINKNMQEYKLNKKIFLYRLEKRMLIYSSLNERVIIPKSYKIKDFYKYYLAHEYNLNFQGWQSEDDKTAAVEYEKKLKLFNEKDEPDDELKKSNISFAPLIKYRK